MNTNTKALITNTQCVIHQNRTENFIFSNSTLLFARRGGYLVLWANTKNWLLCWNYNYQNLHIFFNFLITLNNKILALERILISHQFSPLSFCTILNYFMKIFFKIWMRNSLSNRLQNLTSFTFQELIAFEKFYFTFIILIQPFLNRKKA